MLRPSFSSISSTSSSPFELLPQDFTPSNLRLPPCSVPYRVYVSGNRSNSDSVTKRMNEIRALGHRITYDWTNRTHSNEDIEQNPYQAERIINTITASDVFVAIMDDPDFDYCDTFTELGCALGFGLCTVVYDPTANRPDLPPSKASASLYRTHPDVVVFSSWKRLSACVFDSCDERGERVDTV